MRTAAVFDLDGTLLAGSSEGSFVLYLLRHRLIGPAEVAAWTRQFMRAVPKLGLAEAARSNKMYLHGRHVGAVEELAGRCVRQVLLPRIRRAVAAELGRHRHEGRMVVLLSGTLQLLLEHFRQRLGAEVALGTLLETDGGVFTGRTSGPRLSGEAKAVALRALARERRLDLSRSHGYGDSAADIPFLRMVGFPVAVHPDRELARQAARMGWRVMRYGRR